MASLFDSVRLSGADVDAVLELVRVSTTDPRVDDDEADQAQRRTELQRALAAEQMSLETFTRSWRALERRPSITCDPDREALETARRYLADFGALWRDPDVPAELKEEAAREIFDKLDVLGDRLVAVHPRAEHAWLLGMAAKKSEDVVLVGARGFEPTVTITWAPWLVRDEQQTCG